MHPCRIRTHRGGWIRPHWGETNLRLKMHLGLVVPHGNASGQAQVGKRHAMASPASPLLPRRRPFCLFCPHCFAIATWRSCRPLALLHVTLTISLSTQCRPTMRVGDAASASSTAAPAVRAWAEGEVLFFDDSFEHEVWFPATATPMAGGDEQESCVPETDENLPRIVIQVVLGHPSTAP